MRTIKFRAKAIVNNKFASIKVGDFVYGSYIESECDAPCIIFGGGEQVEIDRKTLGQLIIPKSKFYPSVYEGDLMNNGCDFDYVLKWSDDIYSWICSPTNASGALDGAVKLHDFMCRVFIVTGNVFDGVLK
jgi:hypothetical protein